MSTNSRNAEALFLEGYNCAQAVLACCGERYGLPRQTAIKVAQAFGGGMGRTGSTCGAATGALMVIGLKHSITDPKDGKTKQFAHKLAREFLNRFRQRNGSLLCRDLLGCDISTEEGFRMAQDKGLTKTVCPKLVKDAADIIEAVLSEEKTDGKA